MGTSVATYVLVIDVGHPATSLEDVVIYPDADHECELAGTLLGEFVDGFGASDCDCRAHLLATPPTDVVLEAAVDAGGRRVSG
ncbi:DUF123 domain-containing protein [Natrialba sp. INN-245]|nr:DUF123 domain-containing protein [Natrialba sp. INN-245]